MSFFLSCIFFCFLFLSGQVFISIFITTTTQHYRHHHHHHRTADTNCDKIFIDKNQKSPAQTRLSANFSLPEKLFNIFIRFRVDYLCLCVEEESRASSSFDLVFSILFFLYTTQHTPFCDWIDRTDVFIFAENQ